LDVRFTVECVFDVIFEFSTLKMTWIRYSTEKRTSKLHIQNASVIDALVLLEVVKVRAIVRIFNIDVGFRIRLRRPW
jgi:hypothetical protein